MSKADKRQHEQGQLAMALQVIAWRRKKMNARYVSGYVYDSHFHRCRGYSSFELSSLGAIVSRLYALSAHVHTHAHTRVKERSLRNFLYTRTTSPLAGAESSNYFLLRSAITSARSPHRCNRLREEPADRALNWIPISVCRRFENRTLRRTDV